MAVVVGPQLDDTPGNIIPTWYFEINNGDVGSMASNFSSTGLGRASIETEAVAIPKVGASVIPYNMAEVLSVFGELT